ncbi:MAG: GNAT family N-acetyltransferase [Myxococcales bacterium]|jgi:RimJ/RimL family protein N-acetyltransferase|nr:GNAT family N-acetyltransferase [Myxococcales bacterium]HRC59165.1 GNAT family N-acetyltransferase [Kofleriaceae bacterium]
MPRLSTPRFSLVPITLPMLEAVVTNHRALAEQLAGAVFPDEWPGEDLIARAFPYSLEAVRADPQRRLWGDSLVVRPAQARGWPPRVVGSVIFHGRPEDGVAEVGYGVESDSRGQGVATEATLACVEWALGEPGICAVQATTFPWHLASLAVIRKLGMELMTTRDHDTLGELLVFERRR